MKAMAAGQRVVGGDNLSGVAPGEQSMMIPGRPRTMSARLGNGVALGCQERLTERSVEDFGSWFLGGPCGDAKDLPGSASVTNVILAHDIGATPEYVASWVVVSPAVPPHLVRGLTPAQRVLADVSDAESSR